MIVQEYNTSVLKKVYSKIFRSTDPFFDAGQSNYPIKAVIYPTYGYYLTKDQFDALMYANKSIGSNEFFISEIEYRPQDPFIVGNHWKCINPSFEEYYQISIAIENAVYSVDAAWGFLISHEDHALLVSTVEFWDVFKKKYSSWMEDYNAFLVYWNNVEVGKIWLKDFLNGLTVKT
jgi:hypothetical protein